VLLMLSDRGGPWRSVQRDDRLAVTHKRDDVEVERIDCQLKDARDRRRILVRSE